MSERDELTGLRFWLCCRCGDILPYSCIVVENKEYCRECWIRYVKEVPHDKTN